MFKSLLRQRNLQSLKFYRKASSSTFLGIATVTVLLMFGLLEKD